MSQKISIDDIRIGAVMETTFWPNAVEDSEFRFRATHLDGKRAPKVVLASDSRIQAGIPCRVRIKRIEKKDRPDRGFIEVEFLNALPFKLEGIYIDPIVSKKLQVCLESGLNI